VGRLDVYEITLRAVKIGEIVTAGEKLLILRPEDGHPAGSEVLRLKPERIQKTGDEDGRQSF
jgi:hypothetical protein